MKILALIFMFCGTMYSAEITNSIPTVTTNDPISQIVSRVSAYFHWGMFPTIELTNSAPPEEVVKQVFEKTGFHTDSGIRMVKNYKVLEIRQVSVPASGSGTFTAALLETNLGMKIAFFRYDETMHNWWSHVYDAGLVLDLPLLK